MDDIANAHARLVRDGSVQTRFSEYTPRPPDLPRGWRLPDIGTELYWLIIGTVAVVLLSIVVQAVLGRRNPVQPVGAQSAGPAAPDAIALPASVLRDADALAGAGQYGAAVHALLLQGVAAIQARFPRTVAPAHTSRDIAALPALPDPLRAAFAGIAARTERAVFAQKPLGRDDWDACRALYAGLATPTQAVPP